LKDEISADVCSSEFLQYQQCRDNSLQTLKAFYFFVVFHTRFITFHGGFTFQKLPYPKRGITVMRSYNLISW